MSKLMDIKGYWNMSGGNTFNERDMWEGKILLEDDGWFEGIVNDSASPYVGDRMVFGIYHPNKVIELIKISPAEVSDPFKFSGKRDAKGYDGSFFVIESFGEVPCGMSHIITQDVEIYNNNNSEDKKRNTKSETKDLLNRLSSFKENNDFKDLYENTLAMKKLISEIILRNYTGKYFSQEEAVRIMSEYHSINDKVEEASIKEAKKLAKKLTNDIYGDEELPFK